MYRNNNPEKFRESIERDHALNNCFQKISVNEPSVELSARILQGIKKNMNYIMELGLLKKHSIFLQDLQIDI